MSLLADLVIRFTTQGADQLDKAAAGAKKNMKQVGDSADDAGKKMQEAFDRKAGAAPGKAAGEGGESLVGKIGDLFNFAGKTVRNIFGGKKGGGEEGGSAIEGAEGGAEAAGAEGAEVGATAGAGAAAGPIGLAVGAAVLIAEGIKKAMQTAFDGVKAVFDMAANLLQTGIAACAQGQVLAFYWDKLARTISGAFGPEIQAVIGWIDQATDAISKVTQSDAFSKFMEGFDEALDAIGGVFVQLIGAAEQVFDALAPLVKLIGDGLAWAAKVGGEVFGAAMDAFTSSMKLVIDVGTGVASVIGDLLAPALRMLADLFIAVAEAVAAAAKAIDRMLGGKEADENKKHPERGTAPMRLGGPEAPDAIWMRLAQASIMGTAGRTPEQEHLDVAKLQLAEQRATTAAVRGIPAPFKRR